MRKITNDAVKAFRNSENFSRGNTRVQVKNDESGKKTVSMYLHGHRIAFMHENHLILSSCGWETNTTKERLNGILSEFNLPMIYQKDWTWYIGENVEWEDGKMFLI